MFNKLLVFGKKLNKEDYLKIAGYIKHTIGIELPPSKKLMIENRLYKRLIALEFENFEEYVDYLFSPQGKKELEELANILTTNKTEFFREKKHFEFLADWYASKSLHRGKIVGWSAGCSSGEEAYSLAITLSEIGKNYKIIGTDISTSVLRIAKEGLYKKAILRKVPAGYLRKYFKFIVKDGEGYYQIRSFLKEKVMFFQLNLISSHYSIEQDLDFIFLRNVLIYFARDLQKKVLLHIIRYLKTGGLLFLGHSESIIEHDLPLERIAPSVYQKIY